VARVEGGSAFKITGNRPLGRPRNSREDMLELC
jgi:hypothetical protein